MVRCPFRGLFPPWNLHTSLFECKAGAGSSVNHGGCYGEQYITPTAHTHTDTRATIYHELLVKLWIHWGKITTGKKKKPSLNQSPSLVLTLTGLREDEGSQAAPALQLASPGPQGGGIRCGLLS